MKEKNLNKILKTSIVTFSILTVINCIGIMNSSHALFEKSVDSKNKISMKVSNHTTPEKGSGAEYIQSLVKKPKGECSTDEIDSSGLAYDCTDDNNLRYVGANPNNYVKFNDELWRIIGVMNNIDDGTGNKHSQLKIVKNGYAYAGIEFDNNNSTNYYSKSSLKTRLNGEYYNGLTFEAKNMIENAVWNLGHAYFIETPDTLYSKERGENIFLTGKVGLMYPSDYSYATAGSSNTSRSTCITGTSGNNSYWYEKGSDSCGKNDYLYDKNYVQWTLTPNSNYSQNVLVIARDSSIVGGAYVQGGYYSIVGARPALYLNPSIKINGGSGTETNPYTFFTNAYTKHIAGSNGWSADYECMNGNSIMKTCYYNGIKCDNPANAGSEFLGCKQISTAYPSSGNYPHFYCNQVSFPSVKFGDYYVPGGGMSETISC